MEPFVFDLRRSVHSRINLSFLLDAPAGKDGFVTIRDGHLYKPSGERLRLWGVNVTEWGPGTVMLPPKDDAPVFAAALARFGVNCVRLHFLDLFAPRGLIDPGYDDTSRFDAEQLDRLDFWVAELKRHGIYCDLNLMVGHAYKAGDNVPDAEQIGWGKAVSFFSPRLIELQKQYARQLLTHRNPYTGTEYRHEPAIVIVELVNENSLAEAWWHGRTHPVDSQDADPNWRTLPASYADMLTQQYNVYLAQRLPADELQRLRALAGAGPDGVVARLRPSEFADAPYERFQLEAGFYMQVERDYFGEMQRFLREELGVRALLLGSSDHNHEWSGYPTVWANAQLDILDGHDYWQHEAFPGLKNTPMVNDPLGSTVVRLARTAVAGKPYIVSEVNHPFPHDWLSEGIPILAAYGCLQDWDGILWYTIELPASPPQPVNPFDLALDPLKMPQLAAGALLFLRGDLRAAQRVVARSYSAEQVRETFRMPLSEAPYYTPGYQRGLVLQHRVRISTLDGAPSEPPSASVANPIVADTGELAWYASPERGGLVALDSPRAQALIGFVAERGGATHHLIVDLSTRFCAITLIALDGQPIAQSARLLLTAGAQLENSSQQWNAERSAVDVRGTPPALIEPVRGTLTLANIAPAVSVSAVALDGAGQPIGAAQAASATAAGWQITLGQPATTWYELLVTR